MRHSCYLIFGAKGIRRMTKGPRTPGLSSGEFAVRVTLSVADKFFANAVPAATIAVPDRCIIEPTVTVEPTP